MNPEWTSMTLEEHTEATKRRRRPITQPPIRRRTTNPDLPAKESALADYLTTRNEDR